MNTCESDITFSLVVPVHNEAGTLENFGRALLAEVESLGETGEVIFVDDGSTDDTDAVLHRLQIDCDRVRVVSLSKQFGAPAAVTAGVKCAGGRAVITFDRRCDNWPQLLGKMVANWREGFEIVHAVGKQAMTQPKSCPGKLKILGFKASEPCQRADMRLLDSKVVDALDDEAGEGMTIDDRVAEIGFRQTVISHDGAVAGGQGEAKAKKCCCGADGSPLLCGLTAIGAGLLLVGVVTIVASLAALLLWSGPAGWVWLVATAVALTGVQLVALALVGGYVARVAGGAGEQPLYVVRSRAGFIEDDADQPAEEDGRSGYVVYT